MAHCGERMYASAFARVPNTGGQYQEPLINDQVRKDKGSGSGTSDLPHVQPAGCESQPYESGWKSLKTNWFCNFYGHHEEGSVEG